MTVGASAVHISDHEIYLLEPILLFLLLSVTPRSPGEVLRAVVGASISARSSAVRWPNAYAGSGDRQARAGSLPNSRGRRFAAVDSFRRPRESSQPSAPLVGCRCATTAETYGAIRAQLEARVHAAIGAMLTWSGHRRHSGAQAGRLMASQGVRSEKEAAGKEQKGKERREPTALSSAPG